MRPRPLLAALAAARQLGAAEPFSQARTTTNVRAAQDSPESRPGSCKTAGLCSAAGCIHTATYVRPRTYGHVHTAYSNFTGIDARLLQGRWCTGPLAAGHLRTTTYVRPCYVRIACSRFTAIEANLLQRRWCTGPLAAGHLRTNTYARPRTYDLFQKHRNRGHTLAGPLVRWAAGRWPPTYDQVRMYVHVRTACYNCTGIDARLLQGRWRTGPLAAGHLHTTTYIRPHTYDHVRTTTYVRPVPDSPASKQGSCSAAGPQGHWPLATYIRPRTYDHVRTTTYVRLAPHAPASMPGSCKVAGAQGRWQVATYVRPRTYVRPVPDSPGSTPGSCRAAGAQGRWPLATHVRPHAYGLRTTYSRRTGIETRLLQSRWCTEPLAAGHLRKYVGPPTHGLFQIHQNRSQALAAPLVHRAAGRWLFTYDHIRTHDHVRTTCSRFTGIDAWLLQRRCSQGRWPLVPRAAGLWPPTYDQVRTACSKCTGIEATLLHGRWSTGPLAAGHLRTTTTYIRFQIHRDRSQASAGPLVHRATGRWPPTYDHVRTACSRFTGIEARLLQSRLCKGPLAAGHLRPTTYVRPVPDAPESKPGSCRAAGAQGRWPLATYVRLHTYGLFQIHRNRSQASAEPLVHRAAGRWPPTYDHVHTSCSRFTGIEARLLQSRWSTQCGWPLATYRRLVPDAPESKPGTCMAAGAQGRWPLDTYVRPRTHGLFQIHRNRGQALAEPLEHRAAGRWPPT